jgi:hypothetical protein
MRSWSGSIWVMVAVAALATAGLAETPSKSAANTDTVGIAGLYRLDLLPRYRTSVKVGAVSSYDRTGGNDDGFSGRYSFVRKEGDGLVIADLQGPGVIYRIWTPTPTDDPMELYLDGETAPRLRLKFSELFDGSRPPFVTPVVGYGGGGFYSYLPIPYRTSCKIVIRAPRVQFYQVNYATYPAGTEIASFQPSGPDPAELRKAQQALASPGGDASEAAAPPGTAVTTTRLTRKLAPGKSVTLLQAMRGGRIVGLRLAPASAFAGKERAVVLRITWDGEPRPAVLVPAGDFFGYSWGDPAMRSVLAGTSGDTAYAYFPMPFDRSARVELLSEATAGDPVEIRAEVVTANLPRQPDEGRFYALWRRENPTTPGKPFTFVDTQGRGHVIGVALQAQGTVSGLTPFFEGDDQATIDGELVAHGTGSEDFFNGGWYDVPGRWESRVSFPLSGCLDYKKPMARTGAYRFFVTDAYAFRQSIRLTIEHGPEGNNVPTDYAGVTYLYADRAPEGAGVLPALAARAVHDLERITYTPAWSVPLHAFSFRNATLTKKDERIGTENVGHLSFRATGGDIFGPHFLAFNCELPAAGKYRVSLEALRGPDVGIVQLSENEHPAGERVDLYAPQRGKGPLVTLGVLELKEGPNPVFLKLVGKNPASTGLGLDVVNLHFDRVR